MLSFSASWSVAADAPPTAVHFSVLGPDGSELSCGPWLRGGAPGGTPWLCTACPMYGAAQSCASCPGAARPHIRLSACEVTIEQSAISKNDGRDLERLIETQGKSFIPRGRCVKRRLGINLRSVNLLCHTGGGTASPPLSPRSLLNSAGPPLPPLLFGALSPCPTCEKWDVGPLQSRGTPILIFPISKGSHFLVGCVSPRQG